MTTPAEPRFVLNQNPDAQDVIHRNPGESCNTDDARGRQSIDADTADALIAMGDARPCEHCYGDH